MLTQGMNALTREVATAYNARVTALSRLRKATRTRIARLTEERKRLATRQRASLAQARSKLATHIRGELRQQHDARHALAMRQRADLTQARTDLTRSEALRSAGVSAWMRPITADRVAAHEKWRSLAAAMRGKRTQATTASATKPAAAPASVAPVVRVAPFVPTPVATVATGQQSRPR